MSKAAVNAKSKPATSSTAAAKLIKQFVQNLSEADRNAHRITFLHFVNCLVGSNIELEFNNSSRISGIFHTATPFDGKKYELVLKQVRHLSGATTSHIDPGSTVITDFDHDNYIVHVKSSNVDLINKKNNDLMTDGAIQRNNMSHLLDRELRVASEWVSDASTTDNTDFNDKVGKNWNQFEVNREKFNVQSTYDENLYTKKLDRSLFSKEDVERAERIAKEIESTSSTNLHLQMERGLIDEADFDEEEAFGGVVGTGGLKEQSKSKNNNRNSKDNSDGPWARNTGGKAQTSNSKSSSAINNKNNANSKSSGNDNMNKGVASQSTSYSKIVKGEPSEVSIATSSTVVADSSSSVAKDNSDASKESTDNAAKSKITKLNANAASFVPNPNAKPFVPRVPPQQQLPQQQPPQQQPQLMFPMHPNFDHTGMPMPLPPIDQYGNYIQYMPLAYGPQYIVPQQYVPQTMHPGIGSGYPVMSQQGPPIQPYSVVAGYSNGRNNKVNQTQQQNNVDNISE